MGHKIAIAKKIHLWVGLISGFIATITGLSGSVYVWQPELSQLLNPKVLSIEGYETINENTIHRTAEVLYDKYGEQLTALYLPYREQQSILLLFKNGQSQYFHPATAVLLGEKTVSIKFFEHLLNFHRTFLIPSYGKYIVGGNAVLFILLLLSSGFYLWWKRYKRTLKKGFSLPSKDSRWAFNYDLHKLIGILFLIPLFTIALSGSYFTFMPTWKRMLQILDSPNFKVEQIKTGYSNNFYPKEALRFPSNDGYQLRAVILPSNKSSVYRYRYISNRNISSGLRKTKEIQAEQDSQQSLLSEYHQSPLSEKIAAQAYPVHIGEIFGLFGRISVFITGFIPLILLITGIRYYKSRKSKKAMQRSFMRPNL